MTIKVVGTDSLPSQKGVVGRPRKAGRVSVEVPAGTKRKTVQGEVAALYGVEDATKCAPYARETSETVMTFVVPGMDKDTRDLAVYEPATAA